MHASSEAAFVAAANGSYRATELTRGPWSPEHQHAGPPIALVARAIEQAAAALDLAHIARLTANLLRPIPIGETLTVNVQTEYAGRNVAHFAAQLVAENKEVARLTAVAHREAAVDVPADLAGHPLPQAPGPVAGSSAVRFPFRTSTGYQDLIESRVAAGAFFRGPCAVWIRMRFPLLAGEEPSGLQRVAVAADSGNGISSVLDFRRYVFVNSDLTINLLRRPQGEWICIDAHTFVGDAGNGLAEARIFDARGLVGRSTQSLPVRSRE